MLCMEPEQNKLFAREPSIKQTFLSAKRRQEPFKSTEKTYAKKIRCQDKKTDYSEMDRKPESELVVPCSEVSMFCISAAHHLMLHVAGGELWYHSASQNDPL